MTGTSWPLGAITRLTDLEGQVVRLWGSSLSFVLFLDHV